VKDQGKIARSNSSSLDPDLPYLVVNRLLGLGV